MDNNSRETSLLVFSYLELRKAVGILGMALPFVVSIGAFIFFHTGLQNSISSYYYTGMRDVYVGILFAIGVFLLSYRGYSRSDDIAGDLACLFAVGVAIFPTFSSDTGTTGIPIIAYLHTICAACFLITLSYFSLGLFTKTDPDKSPTRGKRQRNVVYKVCGYVIISCLILMAILSILPDDISDTLKRYHPVFWLEALAIVAFGVSWFTKGEAILKDET